MITACSLRSIHTTIESTNQFSLFGNQPTQVSLKSGGRWGLIYCWLNDEEGWQIASLLPVKLVQLYKLYSTVLNAANVNNKIYKIPILIMPVPPIPARQCPPLSIPSMLPSTLNRWLYQFRSFTCETGAHYHKPRIMSKCCAHLNGLLSSINFVSAENILGGGTPSRAIYPPKAWPSHFVYTWWWPLEKLVQN